MNEVILAALFGATIILLLLVVRWKWRSSKDEPNLQQTSLQLVHRLCPHNNVVQGIEVEQKDSLDEHLDVLTRKLADKNEIENLHALDLNVQQEYRQIMDMLRQDLMNNEKECKKIQEQIEWVSRRRAELNNEVQRGQLLYGEAAMELASNLSELQRGRGTEHRITEKPHRQESPSTLRHRKEPQLPRATPLSSVVIKSSPPISDESLRCVHRH
ncbi:uncharacterized protein LOC123702975 isoform X2 [Colias croceus]|uniref:uncharacterized protein LOC123702975 isoform X2 n=1 Tax=Colias crocea TaxID=72248 RepID=UPI001E27B0D4|nr:uncharacterized protein LOC123702975 isoform X2 [Colias croceus]